MTVTACSTSNASGSLGPMGLWEEALTAFDVSFVTLDQEGRLTRFNEVAERISGYDREEVLGQSAIEALIASEDRAKTRDVLGDLNGRLAVRQTETHWATKGGERRLVRCSAMSLDGEGEELPRIVGLGVDLTRRRRLEREAVETEERLRREIGAELHDMLASHLAGTTMLISALARKVERGRATTADEIRRLAELVREALDQVRMLSHGYVASELETENLASALEQLAEQTETISKTSCACRVDEEANAVLPSDEAALHLCRIAQEAVRNALKHGRPSRIEIALEVRSRPFAGRAIALEVRDNGRGLPEEIEEGVGMKSMRRRVRLLGAELEIEPADEGGTCVRCVLPLGDRASRG